MQHQRVTVEHAVFEIIRELDSPEVAGICTELAEHAVAQVVLIVNELFLLLSGRLIGHHLAYYLDAAVGAGLLAEGAGGAEAVAGLVTLEHESAAVALGHMESRLAVFGLLLGALRGDVFLHRHLQTGGKRLDAADYSSEI